MKLETTKTSLTFRESTLGIQRGTFLEERWKSLSPGPCVGTGGRAGQEAVPAFKHCCSRQPEGMGNFPHHLLQTLSMPTANVFQRKEEQDIPLKAIFGIICPWGSLPLLIYSCLYVNFSLKNSYCSLLTELTYSKYNCKCPVCTFFVPFVILYTAIMFFPHFVRKLKQFQS